MSTGSFRQPEPAASSCFNRGLESFNFLDHKPDIVTDLIFDLGSSVTRKGLRVPEQVGEIVRFPFNRGLRPVISFPDRDSHESKEHGIEAPGDPMRDPENQDTVSERIVLRPKFLSFRSRC